MLKNILIALSLALENIRTHFFHTVLSVLGIVIGVTALVAILSLIDGMQKYAFEQINKVHSVKSIVIRTERYKMVDNIRIKKDSVVLLTHAHFLQLKSSLTLPATSYLNAWQSGEVSLKESAQKAGSMIIGAGGTFPGYVKLAHGKLFSETQVSQGEEVVLINYYLASKLANTTPIDELMGKYLIYRNKELKITGILEKEEAEEAARIIIPVTLFSDKDFDDSPPQCIVEAEKVENVLALRSQVEQWLKASFPQNSSEFTVGTDDNRLKQIARDFLLFKVIMSMIVGISIVVGGVGVMNVLLISVTERTVEIGIRKAMGAKRKDIMLQFLSESITISAFGSGLGLIFGILSTLAIVPIIKAFVPVPFEASYTWSTLLIIAIIAVLIGIIFGTYPAMRASRLDPVEAIRRE
jgi:putative ABC transport system permease protein